jgi:hypothetical protein
MFVSMHISAARAAKPVKSEIYNASGKMQTSIVPDFLRINHIRMEGNVPRRNIVHSQNGVPGFALADDQRCPRAGQRAATCRREKRFDGSREQGGGCKILK